MAVAFFALLSINQNAFAQCGPTQSELTLSIDFTVDNFPDEDGWRLVNITDGITLDSACFGTYAGNSGIFTKTICVTVDTSKRYALYAYDDFGDGLDGSTYTLSYTYAGTIATIGSNNFNIAATLCTPAYTNNELADSTASFSIIYVAPPSCLAPTANSGTNSLTSSTAEVSWVENGSATSWNVEWDTAGYAAGTARNTMLVTDTFALIDSMMTETTYDWAVQAICSPTVSSTLAGNSFTTPCAAFTAPFTENFAIFVPNCWNEASNGDLASGPTSLGTGEWAINAGAVGINLYNVGSSDWVLSPTIDFGAGGYELAIDAKVYAWNAPGTASGMGSDDTVHVAISSDNGSTWSSVYSWNAGNVPSTTLSTYRVNLTALTGSNHMIAIYGTEGTFDDPEDYEFEFNNFQLRIPPACPAPTANQAMNVSTDSADVSWIETATATTYRVEWDTAGYAAGTARNSASVMNDTNYTISGLTSNTPYDWAVKAICSPSDSSVVAGNTFKTSIAGPRTLACGTNFESTIFTEEFDNSTSFTGNIAAGNGSWLYDNNNTGSSNTGPSAAHSGSHYIYFETTNGGPTSGSLVSPAITVGVTSAELSFWLHAYGATTGTLDVGVSTSATGPFTTLFTSTGQIQTDELDPFINVGVNLDAYVGQTIYVEFLYTRGSSFTGDLAIDLVEVKTCVSCPAPTNATTSNPTATTVDLAWMENGAASAWEVEYGAPGFTAGTGTTVSATTNPYTLTGLTNYTAYEYTVRSRCSPTDSSFNSSPTAFFTGLPMAGAYTIDSASTAANNFTSFSDLSAIINNVGVSAAVTVTVAAGTYNDQFSLGEIPNTSATNTVEIDGGNNATLTHDKTIRNSTLTIEGTSWLTVKNMTIETTGASDAWGIQIFDSAHHVTIESNTISLPGGFSPTDIAGINMTGTEDNDFQQGNNGFDITISNNSINGGEKSIVIYGSFSASARNQNLTITGNTLYGAADNGLYVTGYNNVTITDNIVDSIFNSFGDACYVSDLENFDISGNYFKAGDLGFDSDDLNFDNNVTARSTISNNMFIGGDDAFYMDDAEHIDIFHNTAYAEDYGLYVNDDSLLDIRNNIFYSNSDNAVRFIDNSTTVTMDNNLYYTAGVSLAYYGGTTYADLPAFQTAQPTLNISSVEGDPVFVSNGSDLHVQGTLANDAGDNTVGVLVDYDGDTRPLAPSTIVDMGADEYAPPATVPYTETFEGFANGSPAQNGWSRTATTNPQWTADAGGTPSPTTGPSVDHTLGTAAGKYVFLETSVPGVAGDSDTLYSEPILLSASQNLLELSYWYHFFGSTIGSMDVMVLDANGTMHQLGSIVGQQQTTSASPWLKNKHIVGGFQGQLIQLVFIGIRGSNWTGDIAIDDVSLDLPPANEIGITDILRPGSGCGLTATDSVEIEITNFGGVSQTNFMVSYSVNGAAAVVETVTATLGTQSSMNYTFQTPVNLSAGGAYNITVSTLLAMDTDPSNDVDSVSLNSYFSVNTFPYSNSFETGTDWLSSGDANWELGTPAGLVIDTASDGTQAWVTDLDAVYADGANSFLMSPCFDFTNVPNPFIVMDIWYDIESQWDGALLQATTDGGATWTVIGDNTTGTNWYNDTSRVAVDNGYSTQGDSWTGDGSLSGINGTMGWVTASHELAAYGGLSSVQLRVVFASDGNTNGDGMGIDNVMLLDSVTPPYYPVGTINTVDASGVADSIGTTCFTSGIVMGVDLDGNNGYIFTFIDMASGSQEGIGVFSSSDVDGYVVTQGDSIMIGGTVSQFRGLTQLSNITSIALIASGVTEPAPIVVTNLVESSESKWLSIPTSWVSLSTTGSGSSNVNLTNGVDTITMRIDSDTDINDTLVARMMPIIPGDTICGLLGTGGQFTFSSPALDGYQILPARWSDLTICRLATGIETIEVETSAFSLVPNPTNGQFELRTSGFNNAIVNITVRDMNGREISNERISNATNAFNKSFDLTGNAKGMYFISIQDGENVTIEKLIVQ